MYMYNIHTCVRCSCPSQPGKPLCGRGPGRRRDLRRADGTRSLMASYAVLSYYIILYYNILYYTIFY